MPSAWMTALIELSFCWNRGQFRLRSAGGEAANV
jgi:hypothetical protein